MAAKLAFIGTHGVGKTVLTFALAGHLRTLNVDADVCYENARHSPFPINERTTLDGQLWILAAQWKAELEASRRSDVVICDRSVLDNYAYMVKACGRQEYLHEFLRQWLKTYDLFCLVPLGPEALVPDSARALSVAFQRQIADLVDAMVEEFGVGGRTLRLPEARDRHLDLVMNELQGRRLLDPAARAGQRPLF